MNIKFCVCSDYHLHSQYPIEIDGLKSIVERAKKNNVDALIHCGDFIIDIKNRKDAVDLFLNNEMGIPAFGCYGNHELESMESLEELNSVYRVENSYYYIDLKGFRFVITDTNYFEKDGLIQHYPGYSVGGPDWTYDHNLLGEEQICWLKETLISSPYPCIILSHASFEVAGGCSGDAEKVQKLLREVNSEFPKRVIMCINGHYHTNSVKVIDNIAYLNVNTVYMGGWIPQKHDLFPKEFSSKYQSADNCVFFKEPLSAIVTVDSEGIIDIEGMETSYIYDVTPEKIGMSIQTPIGDNVPYISNAHIELK